MMNKEDKKETIPFDRVVKRLLETPPKKKKESKKGNKN